MSAEAQAWAWGQDLPPGEKFTLVRIADSASPIGIVPPQARETIGTGTGASRATTTRHLRSLADRGVLWRTPTETSTGATGTAWTVLRMPGAPRTPEELTAYFALAREPLDGLVEPGSFQIPGTENGSAEPGSSGDSTSPSRGRANSAPLTTADQSTGMDAARAFPTEGRVSGIAHSLPTGIENDALDLLRQKRKVNGKIVNLREMLIAAHAVAEFNDQLESDYGLGAHLAPIVMRIRDRPRWDAAKHRRLIQSAFRIRWWENLGRRGRRPTPNVIYGERCFEHVVQDAADEANGRDVKTEGGSYMRNVIE